MAYAATLARNAIDARLVSLQGPWGILGRSMHYPQSAYGVGRGAGVTADWVPVFVSLSVHWLFQRAAADLGE
jgi:hypothetical protein